VSEEQEQAKPPSSTPSAPKSGLPTPTPRLDKGLSGVPDPTPRRDIGLKGGPENGSQDDGNK